VPGPLVGLRVVELPAIGPVPHAAMVLADLGADVVRVARPTPPAPHPSAGATDFLLRGRRSVVLDVKDAEQRDQLLALIDRADVLLDGMRPAVAERLGLGPGQCRERNPGLVYARLTGWGQHGPLAQRAGHDINFIALTGALHAIGPCDGRPVVPLNLVGDFGGGSMLLIAGVLAALFERGRSGQGQVIDVAMVDGASLLMQLVWALRGAGCWQDRRASNLLDSGAPFYDTYQCKDGKAVAVGALEPQFYAALLDGLGLAKEDLPPQRQQPSWPLLRARFTERFASRTRDEWAELFAGTDACVTPVLSLDEVAAHPHISARGSIVEIAGVQQAAPAPRFSRTPADEPTAPSEPESITDAIRAWNGP
jgi:alpha-methylacyl-CoA racemase